MHARDWRRAGDDVFGVGAQGDRAGGSRATRGRAANRDGPRRAGRVVGGRRAGGRAGDRLPVLPRRRARRSPIPGRSSSRKGSHGPSRVVDHDAFAWTDHLWRGAAPLSGALVYEAHVGTFTPEGTFEAAIERLPHLVDLGVTHLELLPVVEFPGERGWGYDGVALFAPHHAYGGPDGLKRLVDAAHAAGLGVILDVVYNHLGPDGNYLGAFGPYFTGPVQHAVGRGRQLRRRRQRRGAGLRLRQRLPLAASTTTSTGCGSTPCTPSSTRRRSTSSRRWPGASPRSRPAWGGASSSSPRATSTTPGWSARPRPAATGSTPPGATTSTTPSTAPSPARRRATTRTSAGSSPSAGRWNGATSTPATTRPTGAAATAGR